jgi:hypothetical protein
MSGMKKKVLGNSLLIASLVVFCVASTTQQASASEGFPEGFRPFTQAADHAVTDFSARRGGGGGRPGGGHVGRPGGGRPGSGHVGRPGGGHPGHIGRPGGGRPGHIGGRPGVGRPGHIGRPGGVRPVHPIARPGRPWVRPPNYTWRPGGAIAAGAALGFITAATVGAYAGAPPAPGYCWYYTDPSRTQGFWDVCP